MYLWWKKKKETFYLNCPIARFIEQLKEVTCLIWQYFQEVDEWMAELLDLGGQYPLIGLNSKPSKDSHATWIAFSSNCIRMVAFQQMSSQFTIKWLAPWVRFHYGCFEIKLWTKSWTKMAIFSLHGPCKPQEVILWKNIDKYMAKMGN